MTDAEAEAILAKLWRKAVKDGIGLGLHSGSLAIDWGTGQIEIAKRAMILSAQIERDQLGHPAVK